MTTDGRGDDDIHDFFSVVDQLDRLIGLDVAVSLHVSSASPTVWRAGIVELSGTLGAGHGDRADAVELAAIRPELVAATYTVGEQASFRVELPRFRGARWDDVEGRCLVVTMDACTLLVWPPSP